MTGDTSGRPSGVAITDDDTLYVSDSESGKRIAGKLRNPGWKNGVRIGSAKDGSLSIFIDGTDPEGLGADNLGHVFAGLTRAPRASPPLIQKWGQEIRSARGMSDPPSMPDEFIPVRSSGPMSASASRGQPRNVAGAIHRPATCPAS